MNTTRENYLKLYALPNVKKEYIHAGPRVLDVVLTYNGKELASKTEFSTYSTLNSQYYTITEYGLDLLKENYDSQIT